MLLGRLKVGQKLWFLAALAVLGIALFLFASLLSLRQSLIDDRKDEIKYLVDTAYSVVENHYQTYQSQGLSEQEAKQKSLEAVGILRYGEDGYFWVNTSGPIMLMHPFKPSLDGQDVSDIRDKNNTAIFVSMAKAVRNQPAGFVEYLWPRPGAEQGLPKLSYVKHFKPWDFIIGTGIYIDDVDEIYQQKLIEYSLEALAIIAVLLFFISFIIRDLKSPINELEGIMAHAQKHQDLSRKVSLNRRDELGDMGDSFNGMIERFRQTLSHMNSSTGELIESSDQLGDISARTNQGIIQQQQQTEAMARSIERMRLSAESVTRSAAQAETTVQQSYKATKKGEALISSINSSISQLAGTVNDSAGEMTALKTDVENISNILSVIGEIAEQTNLLALNAAIEAARAGAQGAGFAVVADEVRTLAKRTQDATQEIEQMIKQLQDRSAMANNSMLEGSNKAQDSVEQVRQAGETLAGIYASISEITRMSAEINSAVQEQSKVVIDVEEAIIDINRAANNTAEESHKTRELSEQLKGLSQQSHQLIQQFVL